MFQIERGWRTSQCSSSLPWLVPHAQTSQSLVSGERLCLWYKTIFMSHVCNRCLLTFLIISISKNCFLPTWCMLGTGCEDEHFWAREMIPVSWDIPCMERQTWNKSKPITLYLQPTMEAGRKNQECRQWSSDLCKRDGVERSMGYTSKDMLLRDWTLKVFSEEHKDKPLRMVRVWPDSGGVHL